MGRCHVRHRDGSGHEAALSMKRRRAREYALQLLFQSEYLSDQVDLGLFWKDKEAEPDVVEFANSIFRGTLKNLEEIDTQLASYTEHWSLQRLATVDRCIMRAGAYEILFRDDIPYAVSINEALEIAKKFSTTESSAFINGVLDRLAKQRRGRK